MSAKRSSPALVRDDWVDVCSAEEILASLDEQGAVNGLPFMPEMLDYLGKRFRVSRRVEHFSFDGDELCGDESSVRAFADHDVLVLENSRCSGLAHGECKRGCSIFWREAWLRATREDAPPADAGSPAAQTLLKTRLTTKPTDNSDLYYCQSSQLLSITYPVSGQERVWRCLRNVTTGNYSALEMLRNILVWIWTRGREKLLGPYPSGKLEKTPVGELNLQVGEWVEVKSLAEIIQTLNPKGLNRGLHFAPEMVPYCGRRLRVAARADRMIEEGTGRMRGLKNTVLLEDSICDSATWAFGACPRQDLIYWREIWLKRV